MGCGSSGGVPRLGNHWGNCDPSNKRNKRSRCSLLVQRFNALGNSTNVLIDTGPDMRMQLITASIGTLDGVVYTHSHADHVNGIDDLRMIAINRKERVPVWADGITRQRLVKSFDYVFKQLSGSKYPPILTLNPIEDLTVIMGRGGKVSLRALPVNHGEIDALGFRVGDFAYIPDVLEIYEDTWPLLSNLTCLVIDALRYSPHPSHTHLEKTIEWIKKLRPKRAILTNMNTDLDYDRVNKETPENISPAYDGLTIETTI